ncbi:surfeit locus protein 1 [Diaphorina citri]|uniref:SURF1-like protein n=1 Tax=Diaphorina citri TaxID=121845 RepID=A0A1S3D7U8_DIACI|nr:surfeit locus protein 1 [Diaphorina citri]XP_017301178.1 surfeit locus protein 1 [Diaphorina citri]
MAKSGVTFGTLILRRSFHNTQKSFRYVRHSELLKSNESTAIGKYIFLTVPVTTLGLGLWQIYRMQWKENLISELQTKTNLPTVDFPADLSELEQLEYRRVRVQGHFDHTREVYLGPRSLLKGGGSTSTGSLMSQGSGAKSGYYVVTPFILSDRNLEILVNRGWVERDKKDPRTRQDGQVTEKIVLEGIVRQSEARPVFVPKYRGGDVWQYRDLDEMSTILGTSPIFLDACVDSDIPGGPIGGQTRVTLRNEHLSYVLTWLGISVGSSILWWKKFGKK